MASAAITRYPRKAATGPTALTLLDRGFRLIANDVSLSLSFSLLL